MIACFLDVTLLLLLPDLAFLHLVPAFFCLAFLCFLTVFGHNSLIVKSPRAVCDIEDVEDFEEQL